MARIWYTEHYVKVPKCTVMLSRLKMIRSQLYNSQILWISKYTPHQASYLQSTIPVDSSCSVGLGTTQSPEELATQYDNLHASLSWSIICKFALHS